MGKELGHKNKCVVKLSVVCVIRETIAPFNPLAKNIINSFGYIENSGLNIGTIFVLNYESFQRDGS